MFFPVDYLPGFNNTDILVNKYAPTIFTYNNFFAAGNIKLPLGWNFVETASAGVALDSNHGQPVSCIFTNTFKCRQQAGVNENFNFFGFPFELFLFNFCLLGYIVQFIFLSAQLLFLVFQQLPGSIDDFFLFGDFGSEFFYPFF